MMNVFQGYGAGFLLIDVDNSDVVNVKFAKSVKISIVYCSEDAVPETMTIANTLNAEQPDNDLVILDSKLKSNNRESLESISRQMRSMNETNMLPSSSSPLSLQSFHCEAHDEDAVSKTNFSQVLDSNVGHGNTIFDCKKLKCKLNAPCHQMTKLKDRNERENGNEMHETPNLDNHSSIETEDIDADTNVITPIKQELLEPFQSGSGVSTRRLNKIKNFKDRNCKRCQKTFDNDVEYIKHQIVMHANLQCLDCGSGCLCKAHFMMHDESVSIDDTHVPQEELSECPICFELIFTHMMVDPLNNGLYQCCSCERVFKNCTSLVKHFNSNCKVKKGTADNTVDPVECKLCGRFYSSKKDFEKHRRAAAINGECEDCGFKTKSKALLCLHQHFGHVKGKKEDIIKCLPKRTICHICGESCRRSQIVKHIQLQHTKEYLYKCCVCGLSSNTDSLWTQHAECHLNRSNEDSNSLSKQSVLNISVKGGNDEDDLICLLCRKDFKNEKDFVSHHRNETKIMECDVCKTITFTEAGSIVHKYISHDLSSEKGKPLSDSISLTGTDGRLWKEEVPFTDDEESERIKCPCCCDTFPVSDLLFHVMASHTQEAPFQCCSCDGLSLSIDQHLDHCDFHLGKKIIGPKSVPCLSCELRFESRDAFSEHRKKLHNNFECIQCKKDFTSTLALNEHILSRHTSCVCSICGKVFKSKKNLASHEKRHTQGPEARKKQCPKCGLMFTQLRGHMSRAHPAPSAKRFTCNVCGKQFIERYKLQRHEFMHTSIRPFSCDLCLMKFKSELHLRRHLKIHSERPMISCEVCGKKCATRTNMKIHMRIHATSKLFHCEYCDQGFNYKQSFLSHVKAKHEKSSGYSLFAGDRVTKSHDLH